MAHQQRGVPHVGHGTLKGLRHRLAALRRTACNVHARLNHVSVLAKCNEVVMIAHATFSRARLVHPAQRSQVERVSSLRICAEGRCRRQGTISARSTNLPSSWLFLTLPPVIRSMWMT